MSYVDFNGKAGNWYYVLTPDQYALLEEYAESYITDFVVAKDGSYYALQTAIEDGTDYQGIMNAGIFGNPEDFELAFITKSNEYNIFF